MENEIRETAGENGKSERELLAELIELQKKTANRQLAAALASGAMAVIMAIALAEAIQDVFSADEKGKPHPDRYPAPSVERTSAPPCVETVLKYHGFSVCIHLIGLSDESCRLTMLFMGRCRDRQQLFELSQLWSQSLLSTCLSVDIDSEDGLVLSGDLPVPPDFMMVLRMALKRAISSLVIPKTKAYLLAMLQCFGPV